MHAATWIRRPLRWAAAWPWRAFLRGSSGLAAGAVAVLVHDRLRSLVGYGPESSSLMLLAIAAATVLSTATPRVRPLVGVLGLTLLPWLVDPWLTIGEQLFGRIELESLSLGSMRLGLLAACVIPLVTTTAWLALRVVSCDRCPHGFSAASLAGFALGVLLTAVALRPVASADVVAVAAAGCLIASAIVTATIARRDDQTDSTPGSGIGADGFGAWVAFGSGALAACLARDIVDLLPPTTALFHTGWAAVVLGVAGALALARWLGRDRWGTNDVVAAGVGLACFGLTVVALHERLAWWVVRVNAHWESVALLSSFRASLVTICLLPAGFVLGWTVRGTRRPWLMTGGFVLGAVLATNTAAAFGTTTLAVTSAWWLAGPLVLQLLRGQESRRWTTRAAGGVATAFVLAGPIWTAFREPAVPARLLYSSEVIGAVRGELPTERWTALDERRIVASRPGPFGTHTVWSHSALRRSIETGGIPVGGTSLDSDVLPGYGPDVATALLPLVVHEAPQDVLLLGIGNGAATATTLAFPVQNVTCVEGDAALIAALREDVWSRAVTSPFADDRLRVVAVDPAVAVTAGVSRYDVIVSEPPHPSVAHAATSMTDDFYRRVGNRLSVGGVFCQRLRAIDFGPEAVAEVVGVLQAAFPHVRLVSASAGELLLLASHEDGVLNATGLPQRLQAPHVRAVTARCGMDWSAILTLAQLDEESLPVFVESRNGSHLAGDAERLAYRLPIETARWTSKQMELRSAIVELASRWVDELAHDEVLLTEVSTRSSEGNEARQLQRQFPDEWWVYRTTLRRRLQSVPQSPIRQASAGGSRLPAKERARLDFLVSLGDAYREQPPTLDSIRRVALATRRDDPFLTYFAHAETARLLSKSPTRDPAEELEHRLWLVFHGDPLDRSVRNVVDALQLLVEHPEAVPAAADRYDLLNGLLQQLANRWDNRGRSTPLETRVAIKDSQLTLVATGDALTAMETIAADGSVSEEHAAARREYVEWRLVNPLKRYRQKLLAKRTEDLREARIADEDSVDSDDPSEVDPPEDDRDPVSEPDDEDLFDFGEKFRDSLGLDAED